MDRSHGKPGPGAGGLDLFEAGLAGLGGTLGAGVFLALGPAAERAGPGLLLSLLLAAAVAWVCGPAAFAPPADAPPARGGIAPWKAALDFVRLAAALAAAGAVAGVFAAYLAPAATPAMQRALAASLVVALAALASAGLRPPLALTGGLLAVALAALAFLVGLALPQVQTANFRPLLPHGLGGVWQAAALLVFAFAGPERFGLRLLPPPLSERAAPVAASVRVGLALILYLVLAAAAVGTAGALFTGHDLAGRAYNAPLLIVASLSSWPLVARAMVAVGAAAALIPVLWWLLVGIGAVARAMARSGALPPALAEGLPGSLAPWRVLVLAGSVAAICAAAAAPLALLAASAFLLLLHDAGANVRALALREGNAARRVVRVVGLVLVLALAFSLPRPAIVSGLAVAAAAPALSALGAIWRR